jgi:hypothetical protein
MAVIRHVAPQQNSPRPTAGRVEQSEGLQAHPSRIPPRLHPFHVHGVGQVADAKGAFGLTKQHSRWAPCPQGGQLLSFPAVRVILLRANAANASAVRLDYPCGQRSLRAARGRSWPGHQDWETVRPSQRVPSAARSPTAAVTQPLRTPRCRTAAAAPPPPATVRIRSARRARDSHGDGSRRLVRLAEPLRDGHRRDAIDAGLRSDPCHAARSTAPTGGPTTSRPSSPPSTSSTTTVQPPSVVAALRFGPLLRRSRRHRAARSPEGRHSPPALTPTALSDLRQTLQTQRAYYKAILGGDWLAVAVCRVSSPRFQPGTRGGQRG